MRLFCCCVLCSVHCIFTLVFSALNCSGDPNIRQARFLNGKVYPVSDIEIMARHLLKQYLVFQTLLKIWIQGRSQGGARGAAAPSAILGGAQKLKVRKLFAKFVFTQFPNEIKCTNLIGVAYFDQLLAHSTCWLKHAFSFFI